MGTNETVPAPWDADQVDNLRKRQAAQHLHAYTCAVHSETALVPEKAGWRCPEDACGYTQDWAAATDVDGVIPAPVFALPYKH
jgi:hypothetical protein